LSCSELRINRDAVNKVANILRKVGLDRILSIELMDPQFKAIKNLSTACRELSPILSYLNALVSYQLNCRGEDYWWEFSDYMRRICTIIGDDKIVEILIEFIKSSKCNRVGKDIKARRVLRLRNVLSDICKLSFREDYISVWKLTYKVLESKPYSKTVVFSIKMLYYGLRAIRNRVKTLPYEIPIPIDRRIAKITYSIGLILGTKHWSQILRCPQIATKAWSLISKLSSIPPLHIDSLIWLIPNKSLSNDLRSILGNELTKEIEELIKL